MIILGVDPGSRITGFGVIQIQQRKPIYLTSGCIRLTQTALVDRLSEIYSGLSEIIAQYAPDEAAVEQIFMHRGVDAALKLGHARGAALVAISQAKVKFAEYAPRLVKQAIVGYGAAEKEQVQQMVKTLLSLPQVPQADAADALAIALCHFNMRQTNQVLGIK